MNTLQQLATQQLRAELAQLENEYASRFTGLNNHEQLHKLWTRIQELRRELELRISGT